MLKAIIFVIIGIILIPVIYLIVFQNTPPKINVTLENGNMNYKLNWVSNKVYYVGIFEPNSESYIEFIHGPTNTINLSEIMNEHDSFFVTFHVQYDKLFAPSITTKYFKVSNGQIEPTRHVQAPPIPTKAQTST